MVSRRFWQDSAVGRIRRDDGLLWQRSVHLPRKKPNKTERQTEHGAAQKPIAKRRENATKLSTVAFVLLSQYQFVIWFSCAQVNGKRNGNAAENATGCAGKVSSKPNSFARSTRAGRFRLLSWRLWDMPPSVSDVRARDRLINTLWTLAD